MTRAPWAAHFGLARTPFGKRIAAKDLFARQAHAEAVARISFCVAEAALGVITGDVGAGKTVALRAAVAGLDPTRHQIIYIANPSFGTRGLYVTIVAPADTDISGLGIEVAVGVPEGRGGWLAGLPVLVARIAVGWQIEVDDPFLPGGATAWVAPARDAAGNDLVLKVGWPHPEAADEANGLRAWDGTGAIRLHQATELPEATVLLLERCRPGTPLRALPPEEHDLVIAGLLRRLWMQPPPGPCFRPLSDMCDYWANRYEEQSPSERGCLEAPLAAEGIRLLRKLPRDGGDAVLLHTDLHAGNVLAAEREPWLAIDPKPYTGDSTYDVTQHIFSQVFLEDADAGALATRMARLLGLDPGRIMLWLFARAVEASPYWAGMADLARSLYPSLT